MNEPLITDWMQVCAALLTMLAAFAALLIASKAPKAAAKWAETYRAQSEKAAEQEKLRMQVFIALMKCRSQLLNQDAIAALNLIDVAFINDRLVREAYRSFIESTREEPEMAIKIIERYHVVIERVARAIGMDDQISVFDIRSGYYPIGLGKLDEAAMVEAEEKLARKNTRTPVKGSQKTA